MRGYLRATIGQQPTDATAFRILDLVDDILSRGCRRRAVPEDERWEIDHRDGCYRKANLRVSEVWVSLYGWPCAKRFAR